MPDEILDLVPLAPQEIERQRFYEQREREGDSWKLKALKPFEVDGWKARGGDINNHHRHVIEKGGTQEFQRVVFFRNVPKREKARTA